MTRRILVRRIVSVASVVPLLIGAFGAGSAHAGALDWATGPSIYDKPGEKEWSASVLPYLWIAGVTGDLTTPSGFTASSSSTFQGYSSSVQIGVEGVIDLRWRRWHVISDGTWVEFSGSQVTDLPLNQWLNVSVTAGTAFGTVGVAYELPFDWGTAVDVYLASRWWHYTTDATSTLSTGAVSVTNSKTVWADVVGGIRLRHAINEKWQVGLGGDVGGGGSDLTWQTYAMLKYMFNRHLGAAIGYRVLGVDYTTNGTTIDLTERGLILGFEMAI